MIDNDSGMVVYSDIIQGTDEWLSVRAGVPTASRFKDILAAGNGITRDTYMRKLVGELITGEPMSGYSSKRMADGHRYEEEARDAYMMLRDIDVDQVGFIKNGNKGCSPDGLVGNDGLIEIKSQDPHILIGTLLSGEMPVEHKPQVQGQLLVSERDWCDFIAYYPNMPMFIRRVYRDEQYIQMLESSINSFVDEMLKLENVVREYL